MLSLFHNILDFNILNFSYSSIAFVGFGILLLSVSSYYFRNSAYKEFSNLFIYLKKKLILIRKFFIIINIIIIVYAIFKAANIEVETILIMFGFSLRLFTNFTDRFFLWFFDLFDKLSQTIFNDWEDTNSTINNEILNNKWEYFLTPNFTALYFIPPMVLFGVLLYICLNPDADLGFEIQHTPDPEIPLENIIREEN